MSRKTDGISDLVATLVNQFGVRGALDRARVKSQETKSDVWGRTYSRLLLLRDRTR